MIKPATVAGTLLAAALALTACAPSGAGAHGSAEGGDRITLPPTAGVFDYQLGETADRVDLGEGRVAIDVVVRDATAEPLEGAYSVCYVNGFQTQPGESAFWRAHDELLLRDADGALVVDPDWPDEFILDPGTADQRDGILTVIGPLIDGCAADGFDAVEIDNLDTWTRFDEIAAEGAHALAAAYVERAHAAGLAIAQKNAAEMTPLLHGELGFDFAVTEECGAWGECAAYTDEYGDHVLQIEYPDALEERAATFDEVCDQPDRAPLAILRDRALVADGSASYVYRSC